MSRANNLCHFAIECDDVERAKRFYEAVFGWKIVPWGPPDYYQIITGTPEEPGVLGDLRTRREPLEGTGNRGFEATIAVASLANTLTAVQAHGGRVVSSRYGIEGVGDLAYFEDTEGNRVGVMQHVPDLRLPEGARV
jgi:predicted enzyme related to lactoylglutathione lyase